MKSTHSRSERKSAADSIKNLLDMLRKNNNNPEKPGLAESLATPGRFEMFSRSADGMLLDFSRVRVDQDDFDTLVRLAGCCGLAQARERLFSGAAVNETEHRPAMHMAMRMQELLEVVPGEDARRVRETGERMREMAESLHVGRLPGNPSQRVTDIIHVGIGGSMLGPQLLCEALPPGGGDAPSVHFLGSVDACPRERLLPRLKPETTVVILASKSFSTPDTLMHGERLLGWLQQSLGDRANQRMFAVTAAESRAAAFGIPVEQILYLPEWVGGRYSLWSAVSLVAAAQSGPGAFDELLEGAARMDRHFLEAAPADNLPVLLGLLGIWHRNVCGYPAWGVIPYDQRLRLLPAHLQQLIMESNGKSVSLDGEPVAFETAPLVFGECGTDAQHSLFQALHQGTDRAPLHFVGIIRPEHDDREAHFELLANMLAQATALATGRSAAETAGLPGGKAGDDTALLAHRTFEGNRPSELLLLDDLQPGSLGSLLALYEHKVFVESVIWQINPFDQWGVELGKTLAPGIRRALTGESTGEAGLNDLLEYLRSRT